LRHSPAVTPLLALVLVLVAYASALAAPDSARAVDKAHRSDARATINPCHEYMSGVGGALDEPVKSASQVDEQSARGPTHNRLSAKEKAEGWQLLFDGSTTRGWKGFAKHDFPATGWMVENGTLKGLGSKGGDIVTTTAYDDFEFAWDWRLSFQGNSGVKYFVDEARGNSGGAIGHEYQTIDDDNYTAMSLTERQKTGAWYDVLPPVKKAAHPVGQWNSSRLVVRGTKVQHWLNGTLVLAYDITSPEAQRGIATSKFKDVKGFADKIRTPILLQDHDTVVWFRNLKLRQLHQR
jgi:Domain of Unknown Function (DUF1080)